MGEQVTLHRDGLLHARDELRECHERARAACLHHATEKAAAIARGDLKAIEGHQNLRDYNRGAEDAYRMAAAMLQGLCLAAGVADHG